MAGFARYRQAAPLRIIGHMLNSSVENRSSLALRQPANKQLQRTVTRRRGDGASAPFHYALAQRFTRQRAAAELRR
jgi:hypothetical protein